MDQAGRSCVAPRKADVSEAHLHRYLAEFDFRYSNRVRLGVNDVARADRALKGIVGKRRPADDKLRAVLTSSPSAPHSAWASLRSAHPTT